MTRVAIWMMLCFAGLILAANPKSCKEVNCGSGSCCPDSWLGPVCFDTLKYGCPTETDGSSTLCGVKLLACSRVCFDPVGYT